jgi:hypothetical protein
MRVFPRILMASLLLAAVLLSACTFTPTEQEPSWPPSGDGLPVFYYFGDPG